MTLQELPVRRIPSRSGRAAEVAARRIEDDRDERTGDREVGYRLTVGQYHRMIESAILQEGLPVELLDGELVWKDRSTTGEDPMTVGKGHAFSVDALAELKARLARLGTHLRIQQPITLPPFNEPEPDVTLAVGDRSAYVDRHPGPADILCVVEVSDSSLTYDRTAKLAAYADAGIPVYVIVNLPDRTVEVYTGPMVGKGRYANAVTLSIKDKVTFPTTRGKGLTVAVKNLQPPVTKAPPARK